MERDAVSIAEWTSVVEYLEAHEMFNAITVATFPHMKSKEQSKIQNNLSRSMNPFAERRAITTEDMLGILKGGN